MGSEEGPKKGTRVHKPGYPRVFKSGLNRQDQTCVLSKFLINVYNLNFVSKTEATWLTFRYRNVNPRAR